MDGSSLSADGRAVYDLLTAQGWEGADSALHCLPPAMQQRMTAMSPVTYLKDIHAPLIILLHDEGDQVIPVGESRRLVAALGDHRGLHYTEMHFSHLDPVKGKLPWHRLAREFGKFYASVYPLFRRAVGA
jgi:hypothetical protein